MFNFLFIQKNILSFSQTFLLDWSDFYQKPNYPDDISPPTFSNSNLFNNSRYENLGSQAIRTTSQSELYVVNCYFYSIKYSGNGIAIYHERSSAHFLVEFSTFVECGYSGVVLYIRDADFAMNRVCALSSVSFTYAPGLSSSIINCIHHSSVAYCDARGYHIMYHSYGFIDIRSLNLSHNTANSYYLLYCYSYQTNNDNIGYNITHSSFANNTADQYCIYLNDNSPDENWINNSNIIKNNCNYLIRSYGRILTIKNTCIMENEVSRYVFYFSSGCTCTLIDCSIDNTQTNVGSITTIDCTSSFILQLRFIETGSCVNRFDIIDGIESRGPFIINSEYRDLEDSQALLITTDATVINCGFYSITYSGNGAAIYLSSDYNFAIYTTAFYECATINGNYFGGGLYISKCAEFDMKYICALRCESSYSSFLYVQGPTSQSYNSIDDSSIESCVAEYYDTIRFDHEEITLSRVNISHNRASSFSAITCYHHYTVIHYSTFAENNATSQYCIYFNHASNDDTKTYTISDSNIIKNIGDIIIYVREGQLNMDSTCMMNNQQQPFYFYLQQSNAICILKDCSIDNKKKAGSGQLTQTGSTSSFVNPFYHHNSGGCVSTYYNLEDLIIKHIGNTRPVPMLLFQKMKKVSKLNFNF